MERDLFGEIVGGGGEPALSSAPKKNTGRSAASSPCAAPATPETPFRPYQVTRLSKTEVLIENL